MYGTANLFSVSEKSPLVTFALFSYNQERYIREAVEGAFSQTYSPLEIILSDDCSSDRTFEIIDEMAKSYSGPHRIVVRKNSINQGVFSHVYDVATNAKGGLVILAAGDDISFSDRTSILVNRWLATDAMGLFSAYNLVDDNGVLIKERQRGKGDAEVKMWFSVGYENFIHGATSAYPRSLFDYLPPPQSDIFNEDAVLTTSILLNHGHIEFIDESLVAYRSNPHALSNTGKRDVSFKSILAFEQKMVRTAMGYCNLCDYITALILSADKQHHQQEMILNRVADTRHFAQIRVSVARGSISARVAALFACRSLREIRHVLPRLIGIYIFARLKAILIR